MMMKKSMLAISVCLSFFLADAQTVKMLNSGSNASLRGLSVVSNDVVWAVLLMAAKPGHGQQ